MLRKTAPWHGLLNLKLPARSLFSVFTILLFFLSFFSLLPLAYPAFRSAKKRNSMGEFKHKFVNYLCRNKHSLIVHITFFFPKAFQALCDASGSRCASQSNRGRSLDVTGTGINVFFKFRQVPRLECATTKFTSWLEQRNQTNCPRASPWTEIWNKQNMLQEHALKAKKKNLPNLDTFSST